MFFLSGKSKKKIIIGLIAVVVSVYAFGFTLFRPTPTFAFVDVNQGVRNVTDNIGDALLSAGLGALVNGASYFMRKIAYDTAKYIAAGGKGQKPLAFQENFGKYLANTAKDSAASAIEQFGEPFGLNLCKPPDLRLQIGLQVSISKIYEAEFSDTGGPQPRCQWNDFRDSWKNSPETLFNSQDLLARFNTSLKTSQGDLGTALSILGKVDNIVADKELAAQLERLEGEGYKAITSIISGDIKTPAKLIQEETKSLSGNYQTKLNTDQIAGIYGAGAVQILPMALSVFANTLVNSLLQNVLEKGLLPDKGDSSSVADFYASTINSNRQTAEAAFSYLIAGVPQRPLTAYDVVTEYSSCGQNPGLNNCVMDSKMVEALNIARVDKPLTIKEALDKNLLNGNWPLISEENVKNTDLQYCHESAYCVSNIEKLRKARILPLGFEIAVRKSPPDQPWTLRQVVDGFSDCGTGNQFCKLIDPNWILKAPEARCEAKVNGPELLTESVSTRREECVDFSTCLQTDANGQCIGYGYCTQEQNTWKMPGASCAPQFNTCKTYTSIGSGQVGSYLSRTLDVQSCTADSVGCVAYSLEKPGDKWKATNAVDTSLTFAGRTQAIHLNSKGSTQQCPANAEGCNLFMDPALDPGTRDAQLLLKKAPDYLQCYDVDLSTPSTVEWPQTQAELAKLSTQKAVACSQFAQACTSDEVGCQEYRPKSGGTSVTGIVGGNTCPAQCIGYETFKQEATNFESAKFPLNFIASNAKTCSKQYVGCDEFTNIGAVNSGGEALEYYTELKRCELPNGNNEKVFYSWEGSSSQGFILKRHTLLQITQNDVNYIGGLGLGNVALEFSVGSPAYVDDAKDALQGNYDRCNQDAYNILLDNRYNTEAAHPDCRAFYDSEGEIYYRLFQKTVTVSPACTPLRKTNSELAVDTHITNANTCSQKGGLWEGSSCKRCPGGGRYELNQQGVGSCVYQSIKSEAKSCPATANGCRSYIGNTGNNLQFTKVFTFEPSGNSPDALNEAKAGWTGNTSIEAESLQVGLHSLRVSGANTSYTFEPGKLQTGGWYELRFWARGNASFGLTAGFAQNGQAIGKQFTFDPLTNTNILAPINIGWQEYTIGPVQFTGDATKPTQVYFGGQSIGTSGTEARYTAVLSGVAEDTSGTTGGSDHFNGESLYRVRLNRMTEIESKHVITYTYSGQGTPGTFQSLSAMTTEQLTQLTLEWLTQSEINALASVFSTYGGFSLRGTLIFLNTSSVEIGNSGMAADQVFPLFTAIKNASTKVNIAIGWTDEVEQFRSQVINSLMSHVPQFNSGFNIQDATEIVEDIKTDANGAHLSGGILVDGNLTLSQAEQLQSQIEAQFSGRDLIALEVSETVPGSSPSSGSSPNRQALINEIVSITGLSTENATSLVQSVENGASAGIKSNITNTEYQTIKNRLEAVGGIVARQTYSQPQPPISVNQFYFLDNIEFVQIGLRDEDHVFLVKNSWRTAEGYEVPLVCDSTPNDGLPGAALGCRLYAQVGLNGKTTDVSITGFDRLCRTEAVGCRAVVDTQNTISGDRAEEKQAYGVVCRKPSATVQQTTCTVQLNESPENKPTYSCTVEKGKSECRIKTAITLGAQLGFINGCIADGTTANSSCSGTKDKLYIDNSTVVIKADSDLIYLTQREQYLCQQQYLGCTRAGLETKNPGGTGATAYSYQETFIKNDPTTYGNVLCSGDQVGCAAYKQDNNLVYFKDPKLTGNALCVYKENVIVGGKKTSGWFTDISNGTTPCYPNYLQPGNEYGLWSQGSPGYQGLVGVCDSNNNGCTELVDRSSITPSTPKGKSYYVLLNDRLTQNVSQCEGKVSQKEGCVLFDVTENPSKIYNTALSYEASAGATPPNSLVAPATVGNRDANLILKVERDRQCSEWLACQSSITKFDESGKPITLCEKYAACNQLGSSGECTSWVNASLDNSRMTEEKYVSRPTNWSSPEYSGYTLYGAYNPSNYVYLLFPGKDQAYLAYEMSHSFFARDTNSPSTDFEERGCRVVNQENEYVKRDGDICGLDDGGRCYRQKCLYPITGNFTFKAQLATPGESESQAEIRSENNVENMLKELQPGICKAYPEKDSPFKISIAVKNSNNADDLKSSADDSGIVRVEYSERKPKYERANVCQPGSRSVDCSCEYVKLEYKSGAIDYWPTDQETKLPPGICTGNTDTEGSVCRTDSDCGGAAKCSLVSRRTTLIGQRGLCLEYDLSRPIGLNDAAAPLYEKFACLTWLPIQVSASSIDTANLSLSAGYDPAVDAGGLGGEAYCVESTARGSGYYDTSLETSALITTHGEFGGSTQGNVTFPINEASFNELPLYIRESGNAIVDVQYAYGDATNDSGNFVSSHYPVPVFDSNQKTDYGRDNTLIYKRYSGQGITEYSRLMELNGSEPSAKLQLMRLFQAYAWRNISPAARVLRLDVRGTTQGDHRVWYSEDSASVPSAKNVYAFAPLVDHPDAVEDSGVLMHPPRLFSSIGDEDYYMNPRFTHIAPVVGTASFSPDYMAGSNNEFIYNDHAVESSLNEHDIKSVHFVPMAYPDGSEGYNPALLTTEVSIDFNSLRESGVEGGAEKVPAYSDGPGDQHTYNIGDSGGERMNRISYLLERNNDGDAGNDCSRNGLLSFCDYEENGVSGDRFDRYVNTSITSEEEVERTEIYRRYVTLIFTSNDNSQHAFSTLLGSSVQAPNNSNQETDPFLATCGGSGERRRNWLAIGMDFNKEGEFLGYISRWCMNTNNNRGEMNGIRFATIADMQDRCIEFAAVVNEQNPNQDLNKAWTDRVWNNSVFAPANSSPLAFLSVIKNATDNDSPGIRPFGSLPQNVATANTLKNSGVAEPLHTFSDYKLGVPYQCQGGDGFGNSIKHVFKLGCLPPENESSVITDAIVKNGNTGSTILRNLFLKYYIYKDIGSRPPTLLEHTTDSNADKSDDISLIGTTQPPRIFELNESTCGERGSSCTAGKADSFTINGENYDESDPIIVTGGSFTAIVNFFAHADDNRMPIKRVMVNWDNGVITNDGKFGLYKNQKPYCASGDTFDTLSGVGRCSGTQLTCKADTDCSGVGGTCETQTSLKFGDASRACDSQYFQFENTYTCSSDEAKDKNTLGLSPQELQELNSRGVTEVCAFKPGVQVLDNWGWCNGTCSNGSGGTRNACYGVREFGTGVKYTSLGGSLFSQCIPEADQSAINNGVNPYTYFEGNIILVP